MKDGLLGYRITIKKEDRDYNARSLLFNMRWHSVTEGKYEGSHPEFVYYLPVDLLTADRFARTKEEAMRKAEYQMGVHIRDRKAKDDAEAAKVYRFYDTAGNPI